jgi:hypothetical protein
LEHQINRSGRRFKKNIFLYLKSVKEPKIHLWASRRNLQAQHKILKKCLKHQINSSKRQFSQKKNIFSRKKSKEITKSYKICLQTADSWDGGPTEFFYRSDSSRTSIKKKLIFRARNQYFH